MRMFNVRALLDAGASLDAAAPNGTTPLMMAAGYGNRPKNDTAGMLASVSPKPQPSSRRWRK